MGNYSFLLTTSNNPEECLIDWDCLSKDDLEQIKKKWHFETAYKERYTNLKQMAKRWNETKFCGYLTQEYIDCLKLFSKLLKPYGQNPRLFYEYEGMCQVWCFEFLPETGDVQLAIYDYLPVLEALPNCPKHYTSELHAKWQSMYNQVELYCQQSCIDSYDWEFMKL
jgi:hypothetical protein